MSDINDRIRERIIKLRVTSGVPAREIDRRAGMCEGYLSAIERGERKNISVAILQKYARAFKVPVRDIVG